MCYEEIHWRRKTAATGKLSLFWNMAVCLCVYLHHKVIAEMNSRAFQFGQKKFRFDSILAIDSIFSIRFSNLINLPLVH